MIGVYAMSANGLRAGSGFTVGLLAVTSGHWSPGLSPAALTVGTLIAAVYALRGRKTPPPRLC